MAQRSRKRGRGGPIRARAAAASPASSGGAPARTEAAPASPACSWGAPARTEAAAASAVSSGPPARRLPLNSAGARAVSRSEARNAAVRATLAPYAPGERPWPIKVAAALTALSGVGNLAAYAAGIKIAGKHPNPIGIFVFSGMMLACAVGLWRMWYGAVLAFMALLAIIITLFALFLIEASNLLGFLVPSVVIGVAGFLFWKLVRVLSRIQMPARPRE